MWDVLTWHSGTLSVAWWAVLLIVFLGLVAGGSRATKR
jgi:membrane protein YqaA with SNARE-associated domain